MVSESEANPDEDLIIRHPYLELEYKECQSTEHFIAGVRFTFFASFILFFSILIGAYYRVWTTPECDFKEIPKWFVIGAISVFGFIVGVGALIVEVRNTALIRILRDRSIELENEMGPEPLNRMRIRQRLATVESRSRVLFGMEARHRNAIRMLYAVIEVIWIALIFYSVYFAS